MSRVEEPEEQRKREPEISFESAFVRLEEILEQMHSGTVTLDQSLTLYKEADELITLCNKRLVDAERKIEVLIKNRSGELSIGADQRPMAQEFPPPCSENIGSKR